MEQNKNMYLVLIFVVAAALISMGSKIIPLMNASEDFLPSAVYEVDYRFYLKGEEKKAFVKSYLPQNDHRQRISDVKESSKGCVFQTMEEGDNLRGMWRTLHGNHFKSIKYSFLFKGKEVQYKLGDALPLYQNLEGDAGDYLGAEEHLEVYHPRIDSLAHGLTEGQTDLRSVIKSLFDYVYEMESAPIRDLTSALAALEQQQASCNGKSRLFVALCRNLDIPARLKGGIILEDVKKRTSHLWSEVYIHGQWVPMDVLNGHFASLPANYLELYTGDHFLITRSPHLVFDYSYEISSAQHIPFLDLESDKNLMSHPISLIGLSDSGRMPVSVLTFLLLLPLGGLIIALFKNVVGMKTYGIFLPVLIAYTLSTTGFFLGLALFFVMNIIVVLISIPLNKWGLLHTPRMVSVLIITVVSFLVIMDLGLRFEIELLEGITFFPIIITTLVAERFARSIEEDGRVKALSIMSQTLLVTVLSYSVFASRALATLFIVFPELILLILVLCLLLGRWIGLRLTEYKRFELVLDH